MIVWRDPVRFRAFSPLLALAVAALGLVCFAAPAAAHDQLLSSIPADAETLTEAPSDLTLTFNADIAAIGSEALVVAPDGSDVVAGDVVAQGPIVTVPLASDLSAGTYQVTWRVTSSDGHPIDGTFGFTLELPATSQPPSLASSPTASASPAGALAVASTEGTQPEEATSSPEDEAPLAAGDVSSLPGWVIAVIAVAIVGTIVALLVRLRASSRLRE